MLGSTWIGQIMGGNSLQLHEGVTFEPCHSIFMDCGVNWIVNHILFWIHYNEFDIFKSYVVF
jgi:hypothetical protein